MLEIITSMSQLNSEQLMAVYLEENRKNGRKNFPDCGVEEQLKKAENAFLSYLREDFFSQQGVFYAVWLADGRYLSALRLEKYRDGFLLAGLETAPAARRKGYAYALLRESLQYLRDRECKAVYSHVDKRNAPSLRVHDKCGFQRISEFATLIDGTTTQNSCTLCCYL